MSRYRFYLFLICSSLSITPITLPMERDVEDITQSVAQIAGLGGPKKPLELVVYDSDSEDEKDYEYPGLPALTIPDNKQGKECIALSRGIHFTPSKFNRRQRSRMRKANDAGKAVYCSAAYDLAGQPLDSANRAKVREKAIEIREQIKEMVSEDRDKFQQIYSNQYEGFHNRLGTDSDGGIFQEFESEKNPQVSTSEDFFHSEKYGYGLKFLGADVKSLDPEYDVSGKPKHPYLGKLFAILISRNQMDKLAPYFVVHGHANDDITVSDHFRKNVLSEREVSMPGLIPGNCVVLSVPLRVPSFQGPYKPFYAEKFGISKKVYSNQQKKLANKQSVATEYLLTKYILPHMAAKMKEHIENECAAKNIRLVHKQLDGSFGQPLPSLVNATDYKRRIKQQRENQD